MNKVKYIICFIIEKGFSCFYIFNHQHYFHIFVGYENEMKVVKLNLESLSKLPETMIDLGPQNVLQEKAFEPLNILVKVRILSCNNLKSL